MYGCIRRWIADQQDRRAAHRAFAPGAGLTYGMESVDTLGKKALRWWGFTFRFLVILSIGLAGYLIFTPGSITDVPLSQLTLGKLFGALVSCLIPIGCIRWFFSFPETEFSLRQWGTAGIWTVGGLVVICAFASQ